MRPYEDIARAYQGKVGNPFAFTDALFMVATVFQFPFSSPYRMLEGLFLALGRLARFPTPSSPTIYRRCKDIDLHDWLPQKPVVGPVTLAVNASGLKMVSSSEQLRKKLGDGTKKYRG